MQRLLITGAAGGLGRVARARLAHLAPILRLSHRRSIGAVASNEEDWACDLADKAAVEAMVEGCDGIVHLGGKSVEGTWDDVRASNIEGVFNLYEAARKHEHPRIFFASSNHAIGFHKQSQRLTGDSPPRPDSLYGVSKVFGEAIARMYYDKFGQESALVRIGSCYAEPQDHRMLSTWLSPDDFTSLVECVFRAPSLGCPVIYGASDNDAGWWDNAQAAHIGWHPKDNAEVFRAKIDAAMPRPPADAPEAVFQGGAFTAEGIHEA